MIKGADLEKESVKRELKIFHSEDLFTGSRQILIRHGNDYYRLMITKAGKLVLNK